MLFAPRLLLSLQMHRWTIAITGSACGQELVEKVAQQIRKAGRADRVILGSPSNAKIWKMCGEALPEASRILPNSEVRTFPPGSLCHSCTLTAQITWRMLQLFVIHILHAALMSGCACLDAVLGFKMYAGYSDRMTILS